jgi:6-phosphogluconolactonase (cycloisomerase 2 family)
VFVQTNDPAGNQVVSYRRGPEGALTFAGRYNTGGLGVALTGAVVDKLASQGGLAYDSREHLLVAVNGGSNSITAFNVDGARLDTRAIVPSGGSIPVSVTVSAGRLYVLNAGGTGSVQGFYADTLRAIPGSARSLNLTPGLSPQYLNTPGQIGLTPDGRHLVVTTKANGSDIDVFGVSADGALSATPTVNPSANPVPFGFTFDPAGDLVVTEAGPSALTTYAIHANGTVAELGSVTDGLAALCWVAEAGDGFYYGANAGSNVVTGYTIGAGGHPTVVSQTATDPGPIDLAATPDGSLLYVETGGNGIVEGFTVNGDGSLTFTGSSVAPELPGHSGLEGIAVS